MSTTETQVPAVPRYYYVSEIAAALRRSTSAVQYLIASGQLRSRKVFGRRVVTQADLDEYFATAFGTEAS